MNKYLVSARALGYNNPKYINTRQRDFHKSSCLYALNMVNLSAKPNRILVCEGYGGMLLLDIKRVMIAVKHGNGINSQSLLQEIYRQSYRYL